MTSLRRAGRATRRADALPYGGAGTRLSWGAVGPRRAAQNRRRAIGSAGERLVHTEEVTGSIPVSPTQLSGRFQFKESAVFVLVQQQSAAVGSNGL